MSKHIRCESCWGSSGAVLVRVVVVVPGGGDGAVVAVAVAVVTVTVVVDGGSVAVTVIEAGCPPEASCM